jgi:ribosomal protein S18 acetylase RimI-like enzyme
MSPHPQRFTVEVEIEIRKAVAEDLPALEWMGLYAGHRQIIRRAFASQQAGDASLLLGIAGGFPVAQVWIDFAKKREEGTACVWAVRTFFALQGRGIGKCMIQAAEAEMRRHGFKRAELEVDRNNDGARRFYARHGWRLTGETSEHFDFTDEGGSSSMTLELWTMEKLL